MAKGGNVSKRLLGLVQKIERLDAEMRGLNEDRSEVYKEAKELGIPPAYVREAVRYRRDPAAYDQRQEGFQQVRQLLQEAGGDQPAADGTEGATRGGGGARRDAGARSKPRTGEDEGAGE